MLFALVLLVAMTVRHPVYGAAALVSGFAFLHRLQGRGAWGLVLRLVLPMALMAALINPLFNHRGVTILCYLPSGNPLTLESVWYGLGAAEMLGAVVIWLACFSRIMTTDKLVYLFGRVIPALSLVLAMGLRFVPMFVSRFRQIRDGQKCVGKDGVRARAEAVSILVTWSLEHAIAISDSMRSRGYGLPGRTAFSIFRFEERDRILLGWIVFCGGFLGAGALAGATQWTYYPVTAGGSLAGISKMFPLCYLALCLTPLGMERWYHWQWRRSRGNH